MTLRTALLVLRELSAVARLVALIAVCDAVEWVGRRRSVRRVWWEIDVQPSMGRRGEP